MRGVVSSGHPVPHLIVPGEGLVIYPTGKTHIIPAVKHMFDLLGEFGAAIIKINGKLAL